MNRFAIILLLLSFGMLNGCAKSELMLAVERSDELLLSKLIQKAPESFSGISLADISLVGLELKDVTLVGAKFSNVTFSNSKFLNVTFKGCTFEGVDFSNSEFHNVRFLSTEIRHMGESRYDIVQTTFENALFNNVVFEENCQLVHLRLSHLKKGSSLAIVDCNLSAPIQDASTIILYDSNLTSLLVDRVNAEKLRLSTGLDVVNSIVIKNSVLDEVHLGQIDAKNVVIASNKNSDFSVTGKAEIVTVTDNADSEIIVAGHFDEVFASGFSGAGNLLSVERDAKHITIKNNSGLYAQFADLQVGTITIDQGESFEGISFGGVEAEHVSVQGVDAVDELSFLFTTIENLELTGMTVKELSRISECTITNKTIKNVVLEPNVEFYKRYKKASEEFWEEMLASQGKSL